MSFSLSPAHKASEKYILDPAYNAIQLTPVPDAMPDKVPWIYGNAQLEAWKIEQLVSEGFAASRNVHYERNYGRVARSNSFRRAWPDGAGTTLTFRSNGPVKISLGSQILFSGRADEPKSIALPAENGAGPSLEIRFEEHDSLEPVALLIEEGPFNTANADGAWEWSSDGKTWTTASAFPQTRSGLLPHQSKEPTLSLHPVHKEGNLYDFGITLLGRPLFKCNGNPVIMAGESAAEAQAAPDQAESCMDLVQLSNGCWTSKNALGFRYLHIQGTEIQEVSVLASFHPAIYHGAFACSDETLTRIWMNSALTLRSCMHQLMLDGVKRDRMPWAGDQASNLIANAYSFAESDIIRTSLTALGRPTGGFVNGIEDYSLWWVINQNQYQLYFNDGSHLQRELPYIDSLLKNMEHLANEEGLLRSQGWVFIDWGVKVDPAKTLTALQILWFWAQRCGAELAEKAGNPEMAKYWSERSQALASLLQSRAWNTSSQAWREYVETPESDSPYPNFLSILAGLARPEQYAGLRKILTDHPFMQTPYMTGFALMALAQVGEPALAIRRLREYWGGMLEKGATTFWEDFKVGEEDHYTMYKRPFGRSLCHAWSSGPAALLPLAILGIHPLCDGWKEFTVNPNPGDLQWISATIPTPNGSIEVEAKAYQTTVKIPDGLCLLHKGNRYQGPASVELKAD